MASRSYSEQTIKELFGSAAGRCSFPKCRKKVIHPATELSSTTITGDVAHIHPFSSDGPRAGSANSGNNSVENLMLLCAACHRLVDGQPEEYPVEVLLAMKKLHLDWVDMTLQSEMSNIKFPELEVVCTRIASSELADSTSYNSLPPKEKIKLNKLGIGSAKKITMGLMQAPLVASYMQNMATHIDPDFPKRLIAGFRSEYDRNYENGLTGDGLFVIMEHFASGGSPDFDRHAAGLAVLAHLFQVCDIFEASP